MLETVIKQKPEDTTYYGLTEDQVKKFQAKYGPNALSEKKGLPWYVEFLLNMTGLFNYMLWAGALLCYISYGI